MAITSPRGPSVTLFDGADIKNLFGGGTAWLEQHAPYVNSLNVFPVPDGDSGTNMLLTMQAALREAGSNSSTSAGEALAALSHGALLGARGNSGVILSQIIRGMARWVDGRITINAHEFAAALAEGSKTAYKGVVKPVEGTILTVIREASDTAVRTAEETDDLTVLLDRTVEQARATVSKTPQLLPVLREAGVVDAGGQGLLVILEGALKQLRGESLAVSGQGAGAENLARLEREEGWGYDIQFHILGSNLNVDEIRNQISSMGESALIVGDEKLIKVHIHAPNPGDIIKYAADRGPLVNIILENMQEQYADFIKGHTADQRTGAENLGGAKPAAKPTPSVAPPIKADELVGIATIAVVPGSGLARIFESLGVGAVVGGGPTMNPSTQDLLDAIKSVKSDQVLILPNDKNIILAADQARQLSVKHVEVIPTRTVPEGIAALLAFNFTSGLEENRKAMTDAAKRMRTVELTRASRAARLNGLEIQEGQYIGLIDGELVAAGNDRTDLAVDLLKRAGADNCDILTVYYGSELGSSDAEAALERFKQAFPDKEIELHSGGQPLYPFIISVE